MNEKEIIEITSQQNNLVKLARALDRKKERIENNAFRAEGARHVKEGLDLGWKLLALFFSASVQNRPHIKEIIEIAKSQGTKIAKVSDKVLESITHRDNAQSVVGIFEQKYYSLDDLKNEDLVIALERPKDPGNLGTIIRTLDSTGGKAIILLEESCDPFSTEAIRAAMGSSFSIKIAKANIDDFLSWCTKNQFQLIGTYLQGAKLHTKTDFTKKTVLLMGNEQSGIDADLAGKCDALVKLPMTGRADSLNLAIATGVCLYEIWRQREFKGDRVGRE